MADDVVVGIDLGTTNSAVAWVTPAGHAEVIANGDGQGVTPSVIQFQAGGGVVVGEAARQQIALEERNTAKFFKLDMGTSAEYTYAGRRLTPVDLSAEILKQLRSDAEAALGRPVRRAVITVPAYFLDAARDATRRAGEQAGLEVLQLVNEPPAAAFAYGGGRGTSAETLLVYDLGGGTFDITLVRSDARQVEVVATDGNHHLGGKDWDDRLVSYVVEQFKARHGLDPLDEPHAYHEIRLRAEDAKRSLSKLSKAAVLVSCDGRMERVEVDRATFESLTRDLLSQTETLMERVLEAGRTPRSAIDGTLLVGGSTRMPMCVELVTRFLGKPPRPAVHPDEIVAMGAALLAQQLATPAAGPRGTGSIGGRGLAARRIQDVMSHSMGMIAVSADGERYVNSILIARNKLVPCREVRPFQVRTRAGRDHTTAIYVTQGESTAPGDCTLVGKYEITGIPHEASGTTVLDIAYAYDSSGVVQVSAAVRGSAAPLAISKSPVPDDMSWVHESPRDHAVIDHQTILLAVDLSGSMSGAPLEEARRAVKAFISNSDLAHTSIGLMCFADRVHLDQSPSRDAVELERATNEWIIGRVGHANRVHPFDTALDLLGTEPSARGLTKMVSGRVSSGKRYVVVLTDGVWSCQAAAIASAERCHEAGIEIIAIGFGGADEAFLRRIATTDQAAVMTSAGRLEATFGEIAQVLVEDAGGRFGLRSGR